MCARGERQSRERERIERKRERERGRGRERERERERERGTVERIPRCKRLERQSREHAHTHRDGTRMIEFVSGQRETVAPDGTKTRYFPNGQARPRAPHGDHVPVSRPYIVNCHVPILPQRSGTSPSAPRRSRPGNHVPYVTSPPSRPHIDKRRLWSESPEPSGVMPCPLLQIGRAHV